MPTILLIEDQLETTALVKAIMKMQQIDVIAVERAQDGIDLMRDNPPDMVLMDLLLPEMDGFVATEIIKQDDALKHIPVIAITAASIADIHDKLNEVGANAYISKPFVIPELLDVVKSFLP
jgi:two-component system, cell cycle response regulator DivK